MSAKSLWREVSIDCLATGTSWIVPSNKPENIEEFCQSASGKPDPDWFLISAYVPDTCPVTDFLCSFQPLLGQGCCTWQPQRRYLLIWSPSYDKNAEKFCSHGKFDVVVDTYTKPLCLWITSPALQMCFGRVVFGPMRGPTGNWK